MKKLLALIMMITSTLSIAGHPTFEKIAGKYQLIAADDGLVVSIDISKNGKVKINERHFASGVKAICKNTRADMTRTGLMLLTAKCKVRDGYENIFNKEKKTLSFRVDLSNVIKGNEVDSGDPALKGFMASFKSVNTNEYVDGILVTPKK
jgi:hypothetical protein